MGSPFIESAFGIIPVVQHGFADVSVTGAVVLSALSVGICASQWYQVDDADWYSSTR